MRVGCAQTMVGQGALDLVAAAAIRTRRPPYPGPDPAARASAAGAPRSTSCSRSAAPTSFPADDLAVQIAYQRLRRLDARPTGQGTARADGAVAAAIAVPPRCSCGTTTGPRRWTARARAMASPHGSVAASQVRPALLRVSRTQDRDIRGRAGGRGAVPRGAGRLDLRQLRARPARGPTATSTSRSCRPALWTAGAGSSARRTWRASCIARSISLTSRGPRTCCDTKP